MLSITDELKSRFKKEYMTASPTLLKKDWQITIGDIKLTNIDILAGSLSLTESLCSTEDLVFGSCESAMLGVSLYNLNADITGKIMEVLLTTEGETISYGKFIVQSVKKSDKNQCKDIEALDFMQLFNKNVVDWYNSLTFPITQKKFRDSLCSYIGIEQEETTLVNDDMIIEKTIETNELNGLDVLKSICEINGSFGHMSRAGLLQYRILYHTYGLSFDDDLVLSENLQLGTFIDYETITPYSVSADLVGKKLDTIHYEEYVTPAIDKVCIMDQEGVVGTYYGTGTNTYYITDNFLLYGKGNDELVSILENVAPLIMDRPYKPMSALLYGRPYLEVGDVIYDETTGYISYCLERILTGEQLLKDSIISKGSIERTQDTSLNKEVIKLKQKTAKIVKTVEEVSVELSDLEKETTATFTVMSEEIKAEAKRAQESEASISLRADEIVASVSDLESETNATLLIQSKEIELRVSKGEVSSSISVETNTVTLTGNRLIVQSTNFSLDEKGNAIFSGEVNGAAVNGAVISGGVMSGAIIVSGYGDYYTRIASGIINCYSEYNTISGVEHNKLGLFCRDTAGTAVASLTVAGECICKTLNGHEPITSDNIARYAPSGLSAGEVSAMIDSAMLSHLQGYH